MKKYIVILFALLTLAGAQTAKAAQQQTYDLTICRYDTVFFADNNDVYVTLYTENDVVTIRLDIIVEQGQQFFTNGKTYAWSEMLQRFCSAYVSADFQHYYLADASFTWSLDNQGLEHIAGSATDSLGNIYNFHYDVQPFVPTGDTISLDFPGSLRLEHQSEWYFTGTNADETYSLLLTLLNTGNSPVGHYTEENVDLSYSYLDKSLGNGDYELLFFHDITLDVTAGINDTLIFRGAVTAEDGNVYLIHAFYLEPKPLYRDTIIATDLYINTDYLYGLVAAIRVEASDDQHELVLALSPMSRDLNIYDTYHISPITPNVGSVTYFSDEGLQHEIYEGTVTISRAENGAEVTGTLLSYDNVEYTIHLSYAVPEPTHEADLFIDGMDLQFSTQGAWRISGYSADSTIFISAVFNNDQVAGNYSIVEMSLLYSYIVTDITWQSGEPDAYTYYDLINARLTAELDPADSTVTVTGTMQGQYNTDAPLFNVTLTTRPRQQSAVENVVAGTRAQKVIRNGQLLIICDDKIYSIMGAKVK